MTPVSFVTIRRIRVSLCFTSVITARLAEKKSPEIPEEPKKRTRTQTDKRHGHKRKHCWFSSRESSSWPSAVSVPKSVQLGPFVSASLVLFSQHPAPRACAKSALTLTTVARMDPENNAAGAGVHRIGPGFFQAK